MSADQNYKEKDKKTLLSRQCQLITKSLAVQNRRTWVVEEHFDQTERNYAPPTSQVWKS